VKRDWSPIAAPDAPDGMILFDGVCVLCSRWVDFVIKRDPNARFRFLPIQTPFGGEVARRFALNESAPETNVVVKNGQAFFKLDTVIAVLEELPGWRWTAVLGRLPRPLRDFIYDRIAANRYAVFGRRALCRVPNADDLRHMIPATQSGMGKSGV
jgi:predicted DCC family thiol-disulfide oxidoreductase YuxK